MKSYKDRRGTVTGSGAAAFVALLAAVIILYMLLVPPEYREEILGPVVPGEEEPGVITPGGEPVTEVEILSKVPGRLDKLATPSLTVPLDSVVLFSDVESKKIGEATSVFAQNSLLSEETDAIRFNVLDPVNTQNVLLTFKAKKSKGRIVIKLNGNVVFNDIITQPTITPIPIPTEYLQKQNLMEFRVAGPGWKFWSTNEYLLENVQIVGDVKDVSHLEAKTRFILDSNDLLNTKKARIQFVPNCAPGEAGPLELYINDQMIEKATPLCGDLQRTEFLPQKLKTGENTLTFKTDAGSYIIDQILLTFVFREPVIPTYYFEIEEEDLDELLDSEDKYADLELEFVGPEFKNLDVYINGHTIHIDEKGTSFNMNIEEFLIYGTNAIKLYPRSRNIDVTSLNIKVITE
ncbi:hypothetical protein GF371_03640 [Candidatus Woesearchaeota archaeon]|nr:hypothetical protein [Candidatus Woesearchaeota archaeon]